MSQITGTPLEPGQPPPITRHRPWHRRPGLIIPVVLAVVAAVVAALFLLLLPRTMTVRGTVTDRLTGQPVAGARLHAGQASATTNSSGVFRMDGVATDATLRAEARYYATAQVKAVATPLTVRLAPIPVQITVTGALTGRPLAGRLTTPNGAAVRARADGMATLYRIGPGETVTVTAAGYRPARVAIRSDHTAEVALEPTPGTVDKQLAAWDRSRHYQAIVDWVLRPATGYVFMGTNDKSMADSGIPYAVYTRSGFTDQSVTASVWITSPAGHWDPMELRGMFIGTRAHPVTLAGQQVWHGQVDNVVGGGKVFSALWAHDPVCVLVSGVDQAKVDATMTGIIKAMHGQGT